jgi:hypothetical protein
MVITIGMVGTRRHIWSIGTVRLERMVVTIGLVRTGRDFWAVRN